MPRIAAVLVLFALAAPAAAHPIPNTRYDRTVAVRIGSDGVHVKFTLEVSQLTIWLDGGKLFSPEEIAKLDKTARGFSTAYAKKIAPEIARDLRATCDGQPLEFRVAKIDVEPGEHPRFQFQFQADWPPGGSKRAFTFEDESFDGKPGILALTLDTAGGSDSGVSLDDVIEPDPKWRDKPAIDLTLEQALLLRRARPRSPCPMPLSRTSRKQPPSNPKCR